VSDLSDDARTLIAATRHGDDPRPTDEDRVHRALMLRIGVGAVAGAAAVSLGSDAIAAGLAKAGWSSLVGSTAIKLMAVLAVGGSVTAGGYMAMRQLSPRAESAAPSESADLSVPVVVAPQPPAGESTPSVAADDLPVVEGDSTAAPESAPTAAVSHKPSNLRAEVAAVGSANRSLRDGNAEEALRILDGNAGLLQDGTLREEAAVSRVLALCQLGRSAEATAEAKRFIRAYPRSPLMARVRASCAFQPADASSR